jgi:predicted Zn-dependent protease
MQTDSAIGDLRALIAGQNGFDQADICVRRTETKCVGAHQNRIEDFSFTDHWEVSLRLQKALSCVVVSTSSPERDSLKNLVQEALKLLRNARHGPSAKIRPLENAVDSMEEGEENQVDIPDEEKAQRVLNLVGNIMRSSEGSIEEAYGI